jgi:GAF domain-containing protein
MNRRWKANMVQVDCGSIPLVATNGESDADLILVYGDVTDRQARLVSAWGSDCHGEVAAGAVDVSALVRTGAVTEVADCLASPLFDPEFARSAGIASAVLFRLVLDGETFVVVFGARDQRFANGLAVREELRRSATDLVLKLHGERQPAAHDVGPLESLIWEITETVERMTSLEGLIGRIGELIQRALAKFDPRAHGSIWLVEDRRGEPNGGTDLVLHCRNVFSRRMSWPYEMIRPFGTGLMGWVAEHRLPVHVLVGDPGEVLPDGTPVMEQYIPWREPDVTRAALTVPMIYAGRLVGVLNLERPEAERFPPEFSAAVQLLALHSAQAIQQQRIDQLYSKILGEGDITKLSEMVISEASRLIEAPLACIYLWNVDTQQLRLEASTAPIITLSGERIERNTPCYESPGIGLTRWAFDQRMWLKLEDLTAYADPTHPDHPRHRDDVLHQVLVQTVGPASAYEARVETIDGIGEDHRPFWRITAPGREPLEVPRPIWAKQYRFETAVSRSMIVLPVMDARENGPVLGAMRFSRPDEGRPLTENDVALLQGLAKQIAQAVLRTQIDRAREMERDLLSQVVRMEPTYWRHEFQHRLQERLREMRAVLGADLILVRMLERNELTLVAHDPSEEDLSAAWGERIQIPTIVPVGIGGSGQAAALMRPFYIPNQQHEDSRRARQHALDLGEEAGDFVAFLSQVQSVAAVPLIFGGRVVGTLTAVSGKPTRRRVHEKGDAWCSELEGVQEDHAHYLNYHTRWLGPALETLGVLVRRSRQLSSLSTAVRKLTEAVPRSGIDRGKKVHSDRIHFAAMVVATHHDGLGFHQAFVARCTEEDDQQRKVVRLSGQGRFAWGAFTSKEQVTADQLQRDLEADIDAAIATKSLCEAIQSAWMHFEFELPHLPEAPCLFVRQGVSCPPSNLRVAVYRAASGDAWDGLLNAFCRLFNIPLGSDAARDLALGMVSLGRKANRVKEIMFVTNVGFPVESDADMPYVDPMPIESVDVLDDLGVILTLAEGVEDLDNEVRRYRRLKKRFRMKLNELSLLFKFDANTELNLEE